MMAESITIRVLYVVLAATGPRERWSAARSSFDGSSSTEGWMIVLAVFALIISVILALWTFFQRERTENFFGQKVSELTLSNNRLQKEIAEINEELLEVLGSIIDVEPPEKDVPELNAQQIQALRELSKRLR